MKSLAVVGNQLYVGGHFYEAGGESSAHIARLSLNSWGTQPIMDVDFTGDSFRVDYWSGYPEAEHILEQSPTMRPGTWRVVEEATMSTEGDLIVFSGKRPVASANYYRVAVTPPPPIPPVFEEDFEEGAEGWISDTKWGTTDWEHGRPTAPSLVGAHSGIAVFGTDLDAPYGPGAHADLRSPLIDLRESRSQLPVISFWAYVDFEDAIEGVRLSLLDEDSRELHVFEPIFNGRQEGWTQWRQAVPLHVVGQTIVLRWELRTDEEETEGGAGFFLDDVVVQ